MKVLGTLGLARSAGKLVSGEGILDAIRAHKAKFVIITTDASENTLKRITDKCKFYNVEYIVKFGQDDLSTAIGQKRVAIAICDNGFATKIKKELEV